MGEGGARLAHHWLVFCVAAISIFMMSFDSTLIPIALTDIGRGVGETEPSNLSWISTTQTIAMAAAVVAVGRIGDRTGRRQIFLFGLACYVVGMLVGGTATTFGQVLAGRSLSGIGAACVFPSSLGLVLAAWPAGETTRVISAWTAVGAVAGAVGPSLGSGLVDWLGWRSAFLLHVFTVAPAIVVARRVLPDTERRRNAALPDMAGVVLVAVLLGSLALCLAQGRHWGLADRRIHIAVALMAVSLPLLVHRCRTHAAPVVEPRMLRLPTYKWIVLLCIVVAAGIFANYVVMPQYLSRVWGYRTFGVGLAIVPFSVGASIAAVLLGRLSKRVDEKWILLSGLALIAASSVWLATMTAATPNYWVGFFPGLVGSGIGGWAAALSMLNSIGARDLDNSNYGVGMGVLMTSRQVGSLFGVATSLGYLGTAALPAAAMRDHIHTIWLWLVPVFVAGMVGALALPGRGSIRAGHHKSGPMAQSRASAADAGGKTKA